MFDRGNYYNANNSREGFFSRFMNFFKRRTVLSDIIALNIIIWLIVIIYKIVLRLFNVSGTNAIFPNELVYWLSLPADSSQLLKRPWTLISYMFLHEQFFHILFNMITLYFAGKIFLNYFNKKQFIATYIIGGLFGALFFIVSFNIFPAFKQDVSISYALGASASALAILTAVAAYISNMEINVLMLGNIKFKHLALIFIIIDILGIQSGNAGGHLAHLGGILWGGLYGYSLRKQWHGISDFFKRQKEKMRSKKKKREWDKKCKTEEMAERDSKRQMDKILEKVKRSGYSSLTEDEKKRLFSNNK
ncbi:MAG: rhomboid family intramembrane serine protease [Bacteroidales bacterium]|nr:rhomboid family intramembrane serine protease [Bacteroidales bacterium]